MEDLNLLIILAGLAGAVMSIAALFLKPLEHVKVYASALGIGAAVVICFLPIKISGYDIKEEIDCGSVYNAKTVRDVASSSYPNVSGSEGSEMGVFAYNAFVEKCNQQRRETSYMALLIGIPSLLAFIENVLKVRRKMNSKSS